MRCLPYINLPTDRAAWVSRVAIQERFDQTDLLRLKAKPLVDAYLKDWFSHVDGSCRFIIPPVSVIGGKTEFVNGRHRTNVLLKHLEHVPICFATRDIDAADLAWIISIGGTRIEADSVLELPDLPLLASFS